MADRISTADYEVFVRFLRGHLGHELGVDKGYFLEARLAPVIADFGLSTFSTLADRITRGPEPALRDACIDALTVGETRFFRGDRAFASLVAEVLPRLVASRSIARSLRIWSAACSSGQEAASIAMILAESPLGLDRWDVQIVGTDVSRSALERARAGRYTTAEVARGLSPERLKRYFEPDGPGVWKLSKAIAGRIDYRRQNLLDPPPEPAGWFDLVFARNVLIYFGPESKREVLHKVRRVLADDGFLYLGESETVHGITEDFAVSASDRAYYEPTRSARPGRP